MSDFIVHNGQLTPREEFRISPFDAGLLHGAGLFETLRVCNNIPLHLPDHLTRLTESGRCLGMTIELDERITAGWIADLLELQNISDARVRITVTPGNTLENVADELTVMLSAVPFEPYSPALYEKGMAVIISPYAQNPLGPLTGHKSISYFDRLLALREARAVHAGEAIWFTPDKFLAEGCVSNIFIVTAEDHVLTPPWRYPVPLPSDNAGVTGKFEARLALPGVTRKQVLRLCAEHPGAPGPAAEKMLTIDDLLAAREIFLTNAIMGVMPVTHLERHVVADGMPGPVTRRIGDLYQAHLKEQSHDKT